MRTGLFILCGSSFVKFVDPKAMIFLAELVQLIYMACLSQTDSSDEKHTACDLSLFYTKLV